MIDKDADASATPRNSTPNGVSEIIEKVMSEEFYHSLKYMRLDDSLEITKEKVLEVIEKTLTLQRAEQDKKLQKIIGEINAEIREAEKYNTIRAEQTIRMLTLVKLRLDKIFGAGK